MDAPIARLESLDELASVNIFFIQNIHYCFVTNNKPDLTATFFFV